MNGWDPAQITPQIQSYSLIRGISLTGLSFISTDTDQARQKDSSIMHHSLERRFHLYYYSFIIELLQLFFIYV